MPYIEPARREYLDPFIEMLDSEVMTAGELNYAISRLAWHFLQSFNKQGYEERSRTRAVLQDAADEFYRRVVGPYEDQKIAENGDVYE